jgi:hypothetical protein
MTLQEIVQLKQTHNRFEDESKVGNECMCRTNTHVLCGVCFLLLFLDEIREGDS